MKQESGLSLGMETGGGNRVRAKPRDGDRRWKQESGLSLGLETGGGIPEISVVISRPDRVLYTLHSSHAVWSHKNMCY